MLALFEPPSGLPVPALGYSSTSSLVVGVAEDGATVPLPISPLEGEMAGRPEGGASRNLVEL
jgi:hypothetical protein